MEAKQANVLEFLKQPKQFLIPIYQRTYSWRHEQCLRLWNDIIEAGTNEQIPGHFIGSIVYIESGIYQISKLRQLLVIDGQQRLTTLLLLFHALARAIDDGRATGLDITSKKIRNYYLFNSEEDGELRYKLVLTQSDKPVLKSILDDTPPAEDESSRLIENYKFFESKINEAEANLEALYAGLSKLILVDIVLTRGQDNPQLIFESLNSTGLELSQADLIRNYVLMGLEPKQQDHLYEKYWLPMEQRFGLPESSQLFNRFMRDYLTVKTGKISKTDDVYVSFKSFSPSRDFDSVKATITDLFKYSEYFTRMALGTESNTDLQTCFEDINTLKVDVVFPLLLILYSHYEDKELSQPQFVQILRIIEAYVFRRMICGLQANSLHRYFAALAKSFKAGDSVEDFAAQLILKDLQQRFPNDDEFKKELVIRDVYNFRLRNYLLSKLENYGRKKELVDVDACTIEHVMPQNKNLSDEWQTSLGKDWERIHSTYLHTIGNLTLTEYNSELSDRPFVEKRDMEGGFAESPLRLNRSLANLDSWNEQCISERATMLSEQAAAIWSYPDVPENALVKYKAERTQSGRQAYTLADHSYLTGDMQPLFQELKKRIMNLDSSVKEEFHKLYVAYKASTNFVDVIGQKKCLLLTLNMPFAAINDPHKLCKDMTDRGKWGNGDVQVKVSSKNQLDSIMSLVRQAFEFQLEHDTVNGDDTSFNEDLSIF